MVLQVLSIGILFINVFNFLILISIKKEVSRILEKKETEAETVENSDVLRDFKTIRGLYTNRLTNNRKGN